MKLEGAEQLRVMSLQLKEADKVLLRQMRKRLRAATAGAAEAVVAKEREVLPKRGGLNEWFAAAPVRVSFPVGPRSSGVRLAQGRKQHTGVSKSNLRLANQSGLVRHPNRGGPRFREERRDVAGDESTTPKGGWSETPVPKEFFEEALAPFAAATEVAMREVMDEVARVAGFK